MTFTAHHDADFSCDCAHKNHIEKVLGSDLCNVRAIVRGVSCVQFYSARVFQSSQFANNEKYEIICLRT